MMCARVDPSSSHPGSQIYGFCDPQGEFHSFEGPEGRKLVMAFKGLEDKILANVDRSLTSIRQDIASSVNIVQKVVPNIDKLVSEHAELRDSLDALGRDAFESRSDLVAQIDAISRDFASIMELEAHFRDKSMVMGCTDTCAAQLSHDLEVPEDINL